MNKAKYDAMLALVRMVVRGTFHREELERMARHVLAMPDNDNDEAPGAGSRL